MDSQSVYRGHINISRTAEQVNQDTLSKLCEQMQWICWICNPEIVLNTIFSFKQAPSCIFSVHVTFFFFLHVKKLFHTLLLSCLCDSSALNICHYSGTLRKNIFISSTKSWITIFTHFPVQNFQQVTQFYTFKLKLKKPTKTDGYKWKFYMFMRQFDGFWPRQL